MGARSPCPGTEAWRGLSMRGTEPTGLTGRAQATLDPWSCAQAPCYQAGRRVAPGWR